MEIIEKGPQKRSKLWDGTCNVDAGENCSPARRIAVALVQGNAVSQIVLIMHSDSPTGCANSGDIVWEYEKNGYSAAKEKIGGQGTDACWA